MHIRTCCKWIPYNRQAVFHIIPDISDKLATVLPWWSWLQNNTTNKLHLTLIAWYHCYQAGIDSY